MDNEINMMDRLISMVYTLNDKDKETLLYYLDIRTRHQVMRILEEHNTILKNALKNGR